MVKNLKRIEKARFPVSQFSVQSGFDDQASLGRLWNALGAPGRVCQRNSRSRTPVAKRISGGGEPDPERADQGSAAAFGRRKSNTGRDRSPPGRKALEDMAATA